MTMRTRARRAQTDFPSAAWWRERRGLFALLALAMLLLLPLLLVPPLNGDEAFAWNWARRLDWGYYSHPPMVAWLIALSTTLFGTSVFTVRLPSLVLHLGTMALIYRMTVDLTASRRMGLTAAGLYFVLPLSLMMGLLITTDDALIFFWTAAAYLVKRAVVDGRRHAWWPAGIMAGGALLSKFFALLLHPAVFLFLVFSTRHRRILLRWEPYAAFVLSWLIFSPFLVWNAHHDWLTFKFNFMARHSNEGLDLLKPLHYLVGQLLAASPIVLLLGILALLLFLPAPAGRSRPGRGGQETQRDGLRLYAFMMATPLAVFLVQSFTVRIGAHYTGVVYPLAAVLITAWAHSQGQRIDPARLRRPFALGLGVAGALVISVPLAVIALWPTVLPARYVYMAETDARQNFAGDYFGWHEVGTRIAALREQWGARPEGLFLSTSDYAIASMLDFYTPGRAQFVIVGYRRQDFHGKEFLYWARDIKRVGANTIYVSDAPITLSEKHPLVRYFASAEMLPPLEVRDNQGRLLRRFHFALGRAYQGGEPDLLDI